MKSIEQETSSYLEEYSIFYYAAGGTPRIDEIISEIAEKYGRGCKVYAVFSEREQLHAAVHAIDSVLSGKGLVRSRDDLEFVFTDNVSHYPSVDSIRDSFIAFNCTFNLLNTAVDLSDFPSSFRILSGRFENEQDSPRLVRLSMCSKFNVEQYLVEHADSTKNIVIRAGAGTGKTHTMISRIGYICYMQNIPVYKMASRIVMITFTNEASDQMGRKLKDYFRNCYLLSSKNEYLTMISNIDNMQISTIHAYAKRLIAQLGTEFGYGTELGITSSQYFRRRMVSDLLDTYIDEKKRHYGPAYLDKLGMPIYVLRENIMDFINKLHNKSVNISSIQPDDFGVITANSSQELHELLASIIPVVESKYSQELLDENRIHLSEMMSVLNRLIIDPKREKRIKELQKGAPQFMFVDEFQDTDDTQIETLLFLAKILEYRLFLVGDIKQCIYRFRGAQEKAFDQLHIEDEPSNWLEFSLQRNYRTDAALLDLFDKSFRAWGLGDDELLTYQVDNDRLKGTLSYNQGLKVGKYYKCLMVEKENMRLPRLYDEIKRLQSRLKFDEDNGVKLSQKEKRIVILVRENWQADIIRIEGAKVGISIQTNTGGDLYQSPPALDMMALVNALLHFDEADYLYNLASSNFFGLEVPKSSLYEMRQEIKRENWRSKADEKSQTNYLIRLMNHLLADTVAKNNTWELIIKSLRTKPVLQVIREIYSTLKPWCNYSTDGWKQQYYRMNVDLLFEQLINVVNSDKLTINTLQEYLFNSIASGLSVDSRIPPINTSSSPIQCITVHKSKGLEYGHVILPYCSTPIETIKKSQLHISTKKVGDRTKVGYSMSLGDDVPPIQNDFYNENIEKAEKSREETRILYVAMTRAIRSFSWINVGHKKTLSWQTLIHREEP